MNNYWIERDNGYALLLFDEQLESHNICISWISYSKLQPCHTTGTSVNLYFFWMWKILTKSLYCSSMKNSVFNFFSVSNNADFLLLEFLFQCQILRNGWDICRFGHTEITFNIAPKSLCQDFLTKWKKSSYLNVSRISLLVEMIIYNQICCKINRFSWTLKK